jgi:hypothetical protein
VWRATRAGHGIGKCEGHSSPATFGSVHRPRETEVPPASKCMAVFAAVAWQGFIIIFIISITSSSSSRPAAKSAQLPPHYSLPSHQGGVVGALEHRRQQWLLRGEHPHPGAPLTPTAPSPLEARVGRIPAGHEGTPRRRAPAPGVAVRQHNTAGREGVQLGRQARGVAPFVVPASNVVGPEIWQRAAARAVAITMTAAGCILVASSRLRPWLLLRLTIGHHEHDVRCRGGGSGGTAGGASYHGGKQKQQQRQHDRTVVGCAAGQRHPDRQLTGSSSSTKDSCCFLPAKQRDSGCMLGPKAPQAR